MSHNMIDLPPSPTPKKPTTNENEHSTTEVSAPVFKGDCEYFWYIIAT